MQHLKFSHSLNLKQYEEQLLSAEEYIDVYSDIVIYTEDITNQHEDYTKIQIDSSVTFACDGKNIQLENTLMKKEFRPVIF